MHLEFPRQDPPAVCSFPERRSRRPRTTPFRLGASERTQENGMEDVPVEIRKRFLSQRMVGHWDSLPREGVTAPRLRELKKSLDAALGHRV